MKKLVAFMLALLIVLSFSGCGSESGSVSNSSTDNTPASTSTPESGSSQADAPDVPESQPTADMPIGELMRVGNDDVGYMDIPAELRLMENNSGTFETFANLSYTNATPGGGIAQDPIEVHMRVFFDYKNLPESPMVQFNSTTETETQVGTWQTIKVKSTLSPANNSAEIVEEAGVMWTAYYYLENEQNGRSYYITIRAKDNEHHYVFGLIESFDFTQ